MGQDNIKKLINVGREKIELSEGRLVTWDSSNQDRIFQMQMQIQQNQQSQQHQQARINTSDSESQ